MSPSPSLFHQQILKNLFTVIDSLAKKSGDRAYFAPLDVFLDDNNVPQPDLVYIKKENIDKLSTRGVEGAPDLVVEIISPSNSYIDWYDKKDLYQKNKVKEYWIIDPGNRTLEVFQLVNNAFVLAQHLVAKGKINSPLLSTLIIDLADVFAEE
jgi:Uma2 family endonuclease